MTAGASRAKTAQSIVVATRSVAETRSVAAALWPLLRPGDLIFLGGDLGAGKTAFVQGLAAAMGVAGPVTSPTFTLVRAYEGSAGERLVHADVYRLEHLQEVEDLGLADSLDDGAVVVIEWGEVAAPVLPGDHLEIRLEFGAGEEDRLVRLVPHGVRWWDPDWLGAARQALAASKGRAP